MSSLRLMLTGGALIAAHALCALAAAEERRPSGEQAEVARGRLLFEIHCASCHGREGRGDGPMVDVLRVPPGDLTRLPGSSRPGWETEVRSIIDGREPVGAHGRAEMPVWGVSLTDRGRVDDQEREVEAQIDALVAYLRSLQQQPQE